jgi:tetratricopeptide (TPR) repeat protein
LKTASVLKSLISLTILILAIVGGHSNTIDAASSSSDSSDPADTINRAAGLYDLGRYNESMEEFRKVLDSNSMDAWIGIGNCEFSLGNYQDAMSAYDKAIELNSNDSQAWYRKGNLLLLLNSNREAVECFNRALELRPGYVEAYTNRELAQSARQSQLPIEPLPFITITINSIPEGARVLMDGVDTGRVTGKAEPFREPFSRPEEHNFELQKGGLKYNFTVTTSKQMTIDVDLLKDEVAIS